MNRITTAIIGGTAAYHIQPEQFATVVDSRVEETPFGPSPRLFRLETSSGAQLWYSSRHGENQLAHSARFVNQKALLWALYQLGVYQIFSWNGTGAINPQLRVGDWTVPLQIIDWTRNRDHTFGFDLPGIRRAARARKLARTIDHINQGNDPRQTARPFHPDLREHLLAAIRAAGRKPLDFPLTYLCSEGPRLETAAEIDLGSKLGADLVGMTLCPEIWLAMELGISYASLSIITNFATGRWHHDDRRRFGAEVATEAMTLLLTTAAAVTNQR